MKSICLGFKHLCLGVCFNNMMDIFFICYLFLQCFKSDTNFFLLFFFKITLETRQYTTICVEYIWTVSFLSFHARQTFYVNIFFSHAQSFFVQKELRVRQINNICVLVRGFIRKLQIRSQYVLLFMINQYGPTFILRRFHRASHFFFFLFFRKWYWYCENYVLCTAFLPFNWNCVQIGCS